MCLQCFNNSNKRLMIHKWSKKKCSICNGQNAGPDGQGLIVSFDDTHCIDCNHPIGCDHIRINYKCGIYPLVCVHNRLENNE